MKIAKKSFFQHNSIHEQCERLSLNNVITLSETRHSEPIIISRRYYSLNNLTCRKCTIQSSQSLCTSYQETPNMLLIQINRFSVSNLHGRPRKNNHPFGIYENIKLGLINYTLLGLIEHHGVFIDSGHYVSYIRQSNKWYHCDDKHITETNLLTSSNNVYLMFYAKEVDLGT